MSNVVPIRDGIEVSTHGRGENAEAEELQKVAEDIMSLRQQGLQVMSGLVVHWSSLTPEIMVWSLQQYRKSLKRR